MKERVNDDAEEEEVENDELCIIFNPFQTNGIFHRATYNKVRMVHCTQYIF